MPEKTTKQPPIRKYGKQHTKPKRSRLFDALPQTPARRQPKGGVKQEEEEDQNKQQGKEERGGEEDGVAVAAENTSNGGSGHDQDPSGIAGLEDLTNKISAIKLGDEEDDDGSKKPVPSDPVRATPRRRRKKAQQEVPPESPPHVAPAEPRTPRAQSPRRVRPTEAPKAAAAAAEPEPDLELELDPEGELQVLSWDEICGAGDTIVKIAEASYAEVYRVTNGRGTSIIKVIRMRSALGAPTRAQRRAGLVDEEPHPDADLVGELRISEWLADVPGFVVYKQRYVARGRACPALRATHRAFHRRLRRQDPARLQFYPDPARYLDATRFLVVELGDAGAALEDFPLRSPDQLWDVFLHVAVALARAEAQVEFEHRDLHEGNLCIRRVRDPAPAEKRRRGRPRRDAPAAPRFGRSGLEVTILDYGLSRARAAGAGRAVACDLERDLSLFASEHAPQCAVYRRMRAFLLGGRPTAAAGAALAKCDALDWTRHEPYTNVLWLAYLYGWMAAAFAGAAADAAAFRRDTAELWAYLDPDADDGAPGFACASDVVRFAVEAGWIAEEQLVGARDADAEQSILSVLPATPDDEERGRDAGGESDADAEGLAPALATPLRRSPRKPRPRAA
ncbi:hypothetical protein GGS23DRAFT_599359 [Durotheca rogersii]|uniref:uncharacterized protein n=1 Tax=Durotheca rogersii TaxID=419775 RepID=UPI002220E52A|nr:uncharacterized protein GGS23DRAFT_599359 [Durotheca rogersii]KAI5860550.1 hypothetical protein GGS23DRAFT_599359 [Durotheca rogersii]